MIGLAACKADPTLRVTPQIGRQGGGESLSIEGDDLASHGAVMVYIGGRSAKGIVVESPWLVRVVSPQSEDVGPKDVTLRFADGEVRTIEGGFTYETQTGIVLQPKIGGG